MDGAGLLRLVWPEKGPYVLATPAQFTNEAGKKVSFFRQHVFDDVESAYCTAVEASLDNVDVYFALGAVKEVPDAGNYNGIRTKANIRALRAFWLDLDVKPGHPDAYNTAKDAMQALAQFVVSTGLPRPYVVNSGMGRHVYWPLTEELPRDEWEPHALLLKALTESCGLLADPSRTADCASLLRVPDTVNAKPGRQVMPVAVKVEGVVSEPEDFIKRLKFAADARGVQPALVRAVVPARVAALNAEAMATRPPADPLRVIKGCPHMMWQAQHAAEATQGQWYAAIGLLRHCANGEKACHKFSQLDAARYDKDAVDKKIIQLKNGGYGPTTCAKFELEGSTQCAGCRWHGRITSPIVIGSAAPEAAAPVMVVEEKEVSLPDPPAPFKRVLADDQTHARVVMTVVKENKGGGETEHDEVVYDYDLYPCALLYDAASKGYVAKFMHYLPREGWQELTVALGDIYDTRKMSSTLGQIGVVVHSRDTVERLGTYVRAYIAELQKTHAAQTQHSQLGWSDDMSKFILPGIELSPDGDTVCPILPNVDEAAGQWAQPRGDLETWKLVANIYNKEDCRPHQLGVLAGFAAPLMKLSGYDGALLAMVGQYGSGKTSVGDVANTVFGHRKNGEVSVQDTGNSLYARLGIRRNLLVTFDESTSVNGERWSELAYAITHGHGKARLDRNAQLKARTNWSTLMLTTSNRSPLEALSMYRQDTTAEAARIFEIIVPPATLTKEEADEALRLLDDNFGLAGPVFIKAVMRFREAVKQRIAFWIKIVDKEARIASGERYWSAFVAVCMTALELCRKLNLLSYEMRPLFDYCCMCIYRMRGLVLDNNTTSTNVLAAYLNANLGSMLIVREVPNMQNGYTVVMAPRNEIHIRVDETKQLVYIDRLHFRQYCMQVGAQFSEAIEAMKAAGALFDDTHRIVLGKGTYLKGGQVRVMKVNLVHPLLVGAVDSLKQAQPQVATVTQLPTAKPAVN